MKKKIVTSIALISLLAFTGCSNSKNVEAVKKEEVKNETVTNKSDADKTDNVESSKVEETTTESETKTESEEDIKKDLENKLESIDDEANAWLDENNSKLMEENPELYAKYVEEDDYTVRPEYVENGTKKLEQSISDKWYTTSDLLGYTYMSSRPFGEIALTVDGRSYEEFLSADIWKMDSRWHRHQSMEELVNEQEGYFYDNPKNGPCYVEEQVTVTVYPLDTQLNHMNYDEGEDFTDFLDDNGKTLVMGNNTRCTHYTYETADRNWEAFYVQYDLDEPIEENAAKVLCYAYSKEDNDDYVVVELEYLDIPTQTVDTHRPTLEEKFDGAIEEFEIILQTFKKQ